jgi:hypothetical protein
MATPKPDAVCLAAVEQARAAAVDEAGSADAVGEPAGHVAEGDRLLTHLFECRLPGYRGWQWAVTLTRVPRARTATVNDVVLIAGQGALVPPEWVPWSQRVEPGDLAPGAILPAAPDDPRLVPGYSSVTDAATSLSEPKEAVADLVGDLLLTRARLLSVAGQDEAAERWYASDAGPQAEIAVAAPQQCRTCGFVVAMSGPLAASFGVCANGMAPDDGRVVAFDHGCGAHSQIAAPQARPAARPVLVYDTEPDLLF